MAACCAIKNHQTIKNACPACGAQGKSVSMLTLLHNIKFPDNLSIPKANFYFCSTSECEVGYFTEMGITFQKLQLREKLHIQSGWLCYCFDISKADYQTALNNNTAHDIKNFVIKQTKSGSCACTTRNPSGQCCLADFKRFEKKHQNEHL